MESALWSARKVRAPIFQDFTMARKNAGQFGATLLRVVERVRRDEARPTHRTKERGGIGVEYGERHTTSWRNRMSLLDRTHDDILTRVNKYTRHALVAVLLSRRTVCFARAHRITHSKERLAADEIPKIANLKKLGRFRRFWTSVQNCSKVVCKIGTVENSIIFS